MSNDKKKKLTTLLRNNRGSILVAAIAFAIITAIAGSGLLMLAGNGVNHEQAALDNDKAFAAAETGMRIGLRWLADSANWAGWDRNPKTIYDFPLDGIDDTVLLDDSSGYTRLRSHATSPAMDYIKEILCFIEQSSGTSRVLFGSLDDVNGLDAVWFDGPVHSNAPIYINTSSHSRGDPNSVYFVNGPVTVTNVGSTLRNYGTGPSGNNYNFGIQVDGLGETGGQGGTIDAHFDNTFTHSQDSLVVPAGLTQTPTIPLPQNLSNTRKAVLYFDTVSGIGRARYYYYQADGTPHPSSPYVITNIDGNIIGAQNDIYVLGTVKGRTTVVTEAGMNIQLIGDLVYDDFTTAGVDFDSYEIQNNHGVGSDQNNFIALASGGDVVLGRYKWYLQNELTGYIATYPAGETKFITAALIAAGSGNSIRWISNNLAEYQCNVRVIGSRVANQFFNYTNVLGPEANDRFRFFFDRRLLGTISAPGIPSIRRITSGGNDLFLLKTDWRENNIPKS